MRKVLRPYQLSLDALLNKRQKFSIISVFETFQQCLNYRAFVTLMQHYAELDSLYLPCLLLLLKLCTFKGKYSLNVFMDVAKSSKCSKRNVYVKENRRRKFSEKGAD